MYTRIISCKAVGADSIYSPSKGALAKNQRCYDGKNQNQEKNVRNPSYFTTDCLEALGINQGNGSSFTKYDLCNASENNLGSQCYDHWRKLLESGKDKPVHCTAGCTYKKRNQDHQDKRKSCIGYQTTNRCGKTYNRSNRYINFAKNQYVSHWQHKKDLCQINRHLPEHTL